MYKEGGAFSSMGVSCGNNGSTGSVSLEPLSAEQVKTWTDENAEDLSSEEAEEIYKKLDIAIIEA